MILDKVRKGELAVAIMRLLYAESEVDLGHQTEEELFDGISDMVDIYEKLNKEFAVSLDEIFEFFREPLPESVKPIFDKAVIEFLKKREPAKS